VREIRQELNLGESSEPLSSFAPKIPQGKEFRRIIQGIHLELGLLCLNNQVSLHFLNDGTIYNPGRQDFYPPYFSITDPESVCCWLLETKTKYTLKGVFKF